MRVASRLFYEKGYRATGINEVISQSGVAKATFYHHFPSKSDLGLAYLENLVNYKISSLEDALRSAQEPVKRFFQPLEWQRGWVPEQDYRGCAGLLMAAEEPDPESPLRRPGRTMYDKIRAVVAQLCEELVGSNEKYAHLDARELAQTYTLLIAGSLALSQLYHANWPAEHAIQSLRRLIGE